jgi:hypothetical protein
VKAIDALLQDERARNSRTRIQQNSSSQRTRSRSEKISPAAR